MPCSAPPSERFIGTGLELGGCDPVYVRNDANLAHAVENIVDGAYFNSGQSCCGLQRIYVHERLYGAFVDGFVELTRKYVLGNPLEEATTLGPVVRTAAADTIRAQIAASIDAGGKAAIREEDFPASRAGTPYLAPQVLLDVDHSTPVMREEIFGPVAGIMKVQSDEQAIELMNDSAYGLTAAIWTADADAALSIGDRIETGTWFMNRCDYLDPALAWVGVKDSGRGCTLAVVGYEHLTRPKSFHLRTTLKVGLQARRRRRVGLKPDLRRRFNHEQLARQLELPDRHPLRRRSHRRAARTHARRWASRVRLLVTDPALAALPMIAKAVESCRKAGLGMRSVLRLAGQSGGGERHERRRCVPARRT